MPLFVGMPAFPGDPEFGSAPVKSLTRGDPYSVSSLHLGSHCGTHVDPPVHFIPGGASVDQLDLEVLNGPCRVIEVDPDAPEVLPKHLTEIPSGTERVLFRTGNSLRWKEPFRFFPDYTGVNIDAAEALNRQGVRLVGVDSLSVENDPSGTFPVHHALLSRGVIIVEGLVLSSVPAGEYLLECLPLRVRGGDGGPARAAHLAR